MEDAGLLAADAIDGALSALPSDSAAAAGAGPADASEVKADGEKESKEKKEKKDRHGSGHSGHKKDRKEREGGGDGEPKKEKKERTDYRAMLCDTCRGALKLEDDEQMEDLDAVSKTQPALHHAVCGGHVDCLRALLKIGNQAEGVNEAFKGRTPLHIAVLNCNVDICQCLLDAGADLSPAWQGMPALHLALCMRCSSTTRDKSLAIINHMISSTSFDPNLRDASLSPPICAAAAAADSDVVHALLKAGADASCRDAHGCTALHLALMAECAVTAALLLPHNNALQQNSDGSTCDHLLAALPAIFGQPSPNSSELVDAANMTASEVARTAQSPSYCSEGPCFLFYDSAVTRQHVAEVPFCTEAAARVDVLAGDSGVLLDAASRTSATVISSMPPASLPDLARCHSWSYLARIRELSQSCSAAVPFVSIDADTILSAGSWEAARRSAGGVCAAVDAVLNRSGSYHTPSLPSDHPANGRAFVVARPPGHHCGYRPARTGI
jgi:ankyrin repeat protein